MAFDQGLLNDLLAQTSIVEVISKYIQVHKKGRNYVAICPFHDDKNPSMMISEEKQIFKCFVCGAGGNAISFVEKYEKISFSEAIIKVAEIVGFKDPRLAKQAPKKNFIDESLVPLYKAMTDLTSYYNYCLSSEEGIIATDYLDSRNLDVKVRTSAQIGYCPKDARLSMQFLSGKGHSLKTIDDIGVANYIQGNYRDRNAGRLIFPIHNYHGQVVGFSARRLIDNEESKYINSPETKIFIKSNILYNAHLAKQTAKHDGYVYVLEGFMDVFALQKSGITSVVAIMGTALTKQHVMILRMMGGEVRLCLDGDEAGQMAMMRAIKVLDAEGITYRIVANFNDLRDPDEILQEDGEEGLKKYLGNLVNKAEFALHYYQKHNALKTIEERKKLVFDFLPILIKTTSLLELDEYLATLSKVTKFPIETIRKLLEKAKKESTNDDFAIGNFQFNPEKKALRRYQLAEREILYQMLNEKRAVEFYKKEITFFYDELYRNIANYIVEYSSTSDLNVSTLISLLSSSEIPSREEMLDEITFLSLEKHHPLYSEEFINECEQLRKQARQEQFTKEQLENALVGKSSLEKAKIIAEYNRMKIKE